MSESPFSPALNNTLLSDLINGLEEGTGSNGQDEEVVNHRQNGNGAVEVSAHLFLPGNDSNAMVVNVGDTPPNNDRATSIEDNDEEELEDGLEEPIGASVAARGEHSAGAEFLDPPIRDVGNTNDEAFENGYDTDGEGAPDDLTPEEEELLEEEQLGEGAPPAGGGDDTEEEEVAVLEPPPMTPVAIDEAMIYSLRIQT